MTTSAIKTAAVFPRFRALPVLVRMTLTAASLALAALLLAGPALALDLDSAKAQGLLGETAQGYLAAPSGSPSPAVSQLAASVNLERKARYGEIAAQQGITLTAVEEIAGAKLIRQAPAGQYVRDTSGTWVRK